MRRLGVLGPSPTNFEFFDQATGSSYRRAAPLAPLSRDADEARNEGIVYSETTVPDRLQLSTPISFNDCFGWLHRARDAPGSDIAVVLCSGLIRDALDSHHSFGLLADELATAGYPTLRYDYPGTADSCDPTDGEYWAAWQQSVHDAVDWLRAITGARRVVLAGLRIGATLATVTAGTRDDVAGLILLAPVFRGRSYIRQLRVEAPLANANQHDSLDFQELRLSATSIKLIENVNLREVVLGRGHQVAIFAQADSKPLLDCIQAWGGQGAEIVSTGFSGLEPLLRHNQQGDPMPADFSSITSWLRRAVPARAIPTPDQTPGPARLRPPGCVEIPLRFGAEQRLFGMLCTPDGAPADIAVIIGNTGRDPHYGPGRFGVEFARRLAAEGITSLRIDFAGLGDSLGYSGRETMMSAMFEADRTPDIGAAIDVLEALGYRRFAIQGLCAGAYHALHAGLADKRLDTLLLVNLPVFTWRAGDTIDFVARKTSSTRRYLVNLMKAEQWIFLLKGKFDLSGIVRAQSARIFDRICDRIILTLERSGLLRSRNFARVAMANLSRRGVRTFFLFAPDDRGIDVMLQNFGRGVALLHSFGGASMQIVPDIDHMLSTRTMRQTAGDLLTDFVTADGSRSAG